MSRLRVLPALALAAGLVVAVGGTSAQQPKLIQQPKVVVFPGQPAPGQPKPAPADIPVLPKTAGAFVTVKVSDLVDHPDFKAVFEQLKKTPEAMDGIVEMLGVLPQEIDRVTLFIPTVSARGPGDPVLVLTTREPYNEARVLKSLRAEPVFEDEFGGGGGFGPGGGAKAPPMVKSAPDFGPPSAPKGELVPPLPGKSELPPPPPAATAPAPAGDPLFYSLSKGPFELLILVDEHTLVFLPGGRGGEFTAMALMGQLLQKKATGPLTDAIAAAGNHTVAAGVYLPPLFREFDRRMPPELAPYAALTAARTAVVTGDLGKDSTLTLTLNFEDAAAARRATPVLDEGLKAVAEKGAAWAADLRNGRPSERAMAPLIEAATAGLKKAGVRTDGTKVIAATRVDVGPAAAKAAAEFFQTLTTRKKFVARSNNLKQIGIALHSYYDANQRLPANVYGPKGELLLSWRVHLLPYLEQGPLYKQFVMTEPWDGPNNKKLIEQMPKSFEIPGRDAPKGHTYYQAFVSPDPRKAQPKGGFFGQSWLIEGDTRGQSLLVPDGTSNTFAVVEARNGVVWSKPDDLPFGEKLPPLGEERADGFLALMLDGSVRTVPASTKAETLRIYISGNDGMVNPELDDRPRGFPFRGDDRHAPVAVAELEREREAAEREAAKLYAAVAQATAESEQARAQELDAAAALARAEALFKSGAGARKDVDLALAELKRRRDAAEKSEAELRALKLVLAGKK